MPIYINQPLTDGIELEHGTTETVLAAAETLAIRYKSPTGVEGNWTTNITYGATYLTLPILAENLLNEAGCWQVRSYVIEQGQTQPTPGPWVSFTVESLS